MLLEADGTTLLLVFGSILVSMSLHEAMHAFAGHALGDTTARDEGRLTLNPLKHIDLFTTILLPIMLILLRLPPFFAAKPVPFNPARIKHEEFGAAIVGIVGPLTNLLLAGFAAFLLRVWQPEADSLVGYGLFIFAAVNVGFFVFNMIPFPPLDGSRLLYAVVPRPLQNLMYSIEAGGFTSILIFMFLLFPILAPFIRYTSQGLLNFLLG